MPEPHILLSVVQGTSFGSLALKAAWRAGACPCPAISTLPIRHSSTSMGSIPARSSAARMAAPPSSAAASGASSP